MEPVNDGGQGKVQRPQSQNGKNVAGVHDIGIFGDGENGGNAVHRKDHISKLHQNQGQKQGRHKALFFVWIIGIGQFDKKTVAMQRVGHRQMVSEPFQQHVIRQIRLFFLSKQHLDPCSHQKDGKNQQHPFKPRHQGGPDANHDAPQDHHPQNPPHQNPMLVFSGDGKKTENHGNDKNVIQRQGFFDQKPCQVFFARLGAKFKPHPAAKTQSQNDIKSTKTQTFPHPNIMVLFVQKPQVKDQQAQNKGKKHNPNPNGLPHPKGCQKIHVILFLLHC